MIDRILKWIERHETETVIISSIIGAILGLIAKDCIKALLQSAIDLL